MHFILERIEMIDIVLATSNKGKIKEFNEMANKHGINFVSIKMPDVDENGKISGLF